MAASAAAPMGHASSLELLLCSAALALLPHGEASAVPSAEEQVHLRLQRRSVGLQLLVTSALARPLYNIAITEPQQVRCACRRPATCTTLPAAAASLTAARRYQQALPTDASTLALRSRCPCCRSGRPAAAC